MKCTYIDTIEILLFINSHNLTFLHCPNQKPTPNNNLKRTRFSFLKFDQNFPRKFKKLTGIHRLIGTLRSCSCRLNTTSSRSRIGVLSFGLLWLFFVSFSSSFYGSNGWKAKRVFSWGLSEWSEAREWALWDCCRQRHGREEEEEDDDEESSVECRRKTGSLEIRDDCTFSFFTFYSQRPGFKDKNPLVPGKSFYFLFLCT